MIATVQKNGSGTSWKIHDERSYDVWGSVRSGNVTGGPRGRYCANLGHVQDDESGLVYMRARYYEPGSGRFASEDPAGDGTNWYIYAASNPTNGTDPSGLVTQSDLLATGMINDLMESNSAGVELATKKCGQDKIEDAMAYWLRVLCGTLLAMEALPASNCAKGSGYLILDFGGGKVGFDFSLIDGKFNQDMPHIDLRGKFVDEIKRNLHYRDRGPIWINLFAEGFLDGIL